MTGDIDVDELAALLIAPGGGVRRGVWEQFESKGIVTVSRTRKGDGSPISFVFNNRPIKFSTLQRVLDRLHPPTAPQPKATLSGPLAGKLAAAGFQKNDLERLRASLRTPDFLPSKLAAKPKPITRPSL